MTERTVERPGGETWAEIEVKVRKVQSKKLQLQEENGGETLWRKTHM